MSKLQMMRAILETQKPELAAMGCRASVDDTTGEDGPTIRIVFEYNQRIDWCGRNDDLHNANNLLIEVQSAIEQTREKLRACWKGEYTPHPLESVPWGKEGP